MPWVGTPPMGEVGIGEMKEMKSFLTERFKISFISSIAVAVISSSPMKGVCGKML
jgi:hypothetical protein